MPYINGAKTKPNKALYYKNTKPTEGIKETQTDEPYSPETAIRYYERLAEYEDNQNKALGAIKSILSIDNIERYRTIIDAYTLYM